MDVVTHLKSIVGPTAKFELAFLVVEWEPSDVDFAGALEDTRRQVVAATVAPYHNVRLVRAVKLFVRTAINWDQIGRKSKE